MAYTDSELCQLNGGCVGCCGHDYPSAQKVEIAIDQNTLEFAKSSSLTEFRDRADKDDLRNGLCRNAIRHQKKVLCAIHPAFAKTTQDMRKGHCDIRYLCKTAKAYSTWDETRKKQFREFTASKRRQLTQVEYSIKMDADELLKEFEQ